MNTHGGRLIKIESGELPNDDSIYDKLDFIILGATEIDKQFNVNVITDSYVNIMSGSCGRSDTSHGVKVTAMIINLIK